MPVVGSIWNQYDGYNSTIHRLVKEKYGTVKAFSEANRVSPMTMRKFMKSPRVVMLPVMVRLLKDLGVDPCEIGKIILEGEE